MPTGSSGPAEVYAEALDLAARAAEDRAPEAAGIEEELRAFCELWREDERLRLFLVSPSVPDEAKKETLRRGLMAASTELVNFLQVLVDRHRIAMVEEIAHAFDRRRAAAEGRIEARAVVAREIDEKLRRKITRTVERRYGARARLKVEVRPNILGGVILDVGEEVMDGSLRSWLERVRRGLLAAGGGGRLWE